MGVWMAGWMMGIGGAAAGAGPRPDDGAALRAVPFTDVHIQDSFWSARQKANVKGTLAQNLHECEITGRIANFDRAAGKKSGDFEGYFFNDSDVYKMIEGASDILAQTHDAALDKRLDDLIATIAAAQQPDGYLNTYFTVKGLDQRWTDLKQKHELYCAGHLIEAAAAHYKATGKKSLLDVAVRLADCIDATFGPAPKRAGVCGHEEIELALIKLAGVTGQEKYRTLAEFFIESRGRADRGRELYGEVFQDQVPVREHQEAVGHAVRAMYLYCGVADLAARSGDEGYLGAMERVWDDVTQRKMYITGGIGSSPSTEGFAPAYDLPNDTAYAETCAGIGLVMWAHRLALIHADAKYADVMERGLYNGVLSGVSLDGRKFFYVNPLASRGGHQRQDWFDCACCPPNILRLIASMGQYVYAQTDERVYVNLYVGSEADVTVGGVRVNLRQETEYPWKGTVNLVVDPRGPVEFELYLRIPGWCRVGQGGSAGATINGRPIAARPEKGYLRIKRKWLRGETVVLDLPMPVERVYANPKVKADVGRVALMRGPLVYCLEQADNPGGVRGLVVPQDAAVAATVEPDVLGGVTVIKGMALSPGAPAEAQGEALYQPGAPGRMIEFTAVPYYAWANRAPGEMSVWMAEGVTLAERTRDAGITATASHCYQDDTLTALADGVEPASSADESLARFTWWPRKGSAEWVQYDFAPARRVSGVEVYWFDDSGVGGGCRVPASWKVMYKDGEVWREVQPKGPSEPGTEVDRYNRVIFAPVETTGLRLEVQLKEGASAGILEWRVLR